MKRLILRIAMGLGALILVVVAAGFAVSEVMIGKRSDTPSVEISASQGADAIARGQHLARLYGCMGCHGDTLEGEVWEDGFWVGSLYAANLTTAMPRYTDTQLARAIRGGVRQDGSPLWGMPSESWIAATDEEMADLIAWLRTHKPTGKPTPLPRFGPLGRVGVIMGEFKPSAIYVTEAIAAPAFDAGPAFARGRHLAQTVCSECHNSDLKGREGDTPDLLMAASYSLEDFTRLMRTGVPVSGKELRLMSDVSRSRFAHFSDQDIADLHAYLTARAEQMP